MPRVSESEFINELLVELSKEWLVWRQQSGEVIITRRKKQYRIRLGPDGMADIGGVTSNAVMFQVEAKAARGKQRPSQKQWQQACEQRGVLYVLAVFDPMYSLEKNAYLIRTRVRRALTGTQ